MHDRHSGPGVEVPPVYFEVQQDGEATEDSGISVSVAEAAVSIGTLNMHVSNPDENFADLLCKCDILCLQEVTPQCVEALIPLARSNAYELVTPLQRGSASAEAFDVCMLLKRAAIRKLRVAISPLVADSPRRLLAVQFQLRSNGAVLAIATAHLTATANAVRQRAAELRSALSTVTALQVDGHFLVGDLNMQATETVPNEFREWGDAWRAAGADLACSGTFFAQITWNRQMRGCSSGATIGFCFARKILSGSLTMKVRILTLPASQRAPVRAKLLLLSGAIVEDQRRKALYRLYTRRNCHHMNTHDPLKAMGLVANVDDQVVLTCQAAINYLTKYMGKLGGGHSGSGRIGGLIDDIVCRMRDTDTMTVTSLLSKLFIHAAVPEDICSLEAWHLLFDLPRELFSRVITSVNAKDAGVPLQALHEIEDGHAQQEATRQTKLDIYLQRCETQCKPPLTMEMLQKMSFSQYFARVDRRNYRGRVQILRSKFNIVKEKPFLQLDLRKRGCADMARQCLRLHRPFVAAVDDPMALSDADAVEQLVAFVRQPNCPVWLQKRFARHNRQKRQGSVAAASVGATVGSVNAGTEHQGSVAAASVGATVRSANAGTGPSSSSAAEVAEVQVVASSNAASSSFVASDATAVQADAFPACPIAASSNASQVLGSSSSSQQVASVVCLSEDAASVAETAVEPPSKKLKTQADISQHFDAIDVKENRVKVAAHHGLLWTTVSGDIRYSVCNAIRKQHPTPSAMIMRQYLQALTQAKSKPKGKVVDMMEKYVFIVLHLDLLPYQKRGTGFVKEGVTRAALDELCNAYFAGLGAKAQPKEKRAWLQMSYVCLWNKLKKYTLEQCGLSVSVAVAHRIPCAVGADTKSDEKLGQWRQSVFCLDPHRLEHEEWEDDDTREAKRIRFVQGAMHEQSMGRPTGNKLHEADVPLDPDAKICADMDTRAEWDALTKYSNLLSSQLLTPSMMQKVLPETERWVLKPSQGGLSHAEASNLCRGDAQAATSVSYDDLDPTQASFVDHMRQWGEGYVACSESCEQDLPVVDEVCSTPRWCEPVLLLGTAGTGKTTTVQAANSVLEELGLQGRIVRAAYTGVAASNLGAGGRTLVSLFRLTKRNAAGGLQQLAKEDLLAMAEELGNMCVLEIDEVSMIEKAVVAYVHDRLQQWRLDVYHPHFCSNQTCRCGARLPFGGVKLVFAGDFGQLPPVAVPAERTLLSSASLQRGRGAAEANLGSRLFHSIRNVFRLRRIHRQVGQSKYKESLLRLRDAAHTKEDVALWQTHDLTHRSCAFTVQERKTFEKQRVHLFCENRRAGQFNGQRLGEDVASKQDSSTILRIWSVDSTPGVERHTCDNYGGLRRVLHLAVGAPVMLTTNLRTVWNLVNGARGTVVAVVSQSCSVAGEVVSANASPTGASEVGGVSASQVTYVIVDMPGYIGPTMVAGHPTWVCIPKQQLRHERNKGLARTQFPLVLSYGMTVHKSQGLTLADGCVFNMDHEPTWCPFKHMCGLAFVGMSRAKDFAQMAFKYVPDYWMFFSVKETDIFKWREALEMELDHLHDATAKSIFAQSSVEADACRC
eukprot:s1595_g15.t1